MNIPEGKESLPQLGTTQKTLAADPRLQCPNLQLSSVACTLSKCRSCVGTAELPGRISSPCTASFSIVTTPTFRTIATSAMLDYHRDASATSPHKNISGTLKTSNYFVGEFCCVTRKTCLLCDTANNVCCVTQKTGLLCDTAGHVCCVTQQTCPLCDTAGVSAV